MLGLCIGVGGIPVAGPSFLYIVFCFVLGSFLVAVVTIVFTILFTFTFFVTQFAASCTNHLYSSLIHNTLPQHSLVLLFFCFIFIYAASTQPYALLLSDTLPQCSFTIIYAQP